MENRLPEKVEQIFELTKTIVEEKIIDKTKLIEIEKKISSYLNEQNIKTKYFKRLFK